MEIKKIPIPTDRNNPTDFIKDLSAIYK